MKKVITKELDNILTNSKHIEYREINLYLLTKNELEEVLQLELKVRANNVEKGIEKKNHFYEYAKIINPQYPAFKYTLSMKHKKKEIFDPVKVQKAIPIEFEIWKNKSRIELEKEINNPNSAISDELAKKLREELERNIISSKEKIEKVLNNYHEYDVIITTFEQYTYYPALYYVMEVEDSKTKASDTHLRKDVPNLLWFKDERDFAELRANDKMSRIIQTFERYCDIIYINKK